MPSCISRRACIGRKPGPCRWQPIGATTSRSPSAWLARRPLRVSRTSCSPASVKVHGEITIAGQPFTESDPPDPHDEYATSQVRGRACAANHRGSQRAAHDGLAPAADLRTRRQGELRRGSPTPCAVACRCRSPASTIAAACSASTTWSTRSAWYWATTEPQERGRMTPYLLADGEPVSTPDLVRAVAAALGVDAHLFAVPAGCCASPACAQDTLRRQRGSPLRSRSIPGPSAIASAGSRRARWRRDSRPPSWLGRSRRVAAGPLCFALHFPRVPSRTERRWRAAIILPSVSTRFHVVTFMPAARPTSCARCASRAASPATPKARCWSRWARPTCCARRASRKACRRSSRARGRAGSPPSTACCRARPTRGCGARRRKASSRDARRRSSA